MIEATTPPGNQAGGHAAMMDRMYRMQRHFYDVSRKYYLFGRDRLIARMPVGPGHHVLEVGCGTARNLICLARRHPEATFYGLDASDAMLATAGKKLAGRGLRQQIQLRQGLAEELDPQAMFGRAHFDAIFFSYSLSMIPTWQPALDVALQSLKPGGQLWIVDFWDQAELPGWFRQGLVRWLKLFHVEHRPELIGYLQTLPVKTGCTFTLESIGRGYAFLGYLERPS
jgi:S-adenosylmethionine-diacylgycerolhomoserine-N-methlytransferase